MIKSMFQNSVVFLPDSSAGPFSLSKTHPQVSSK